MVDQVVFLQCAGHKINESGVLCTRSHFGDVPRTKGPFNFVNLSDMAMNRRIVMPFI